MATYPNRVSVPTAITDHSNQNLSCKHITTGNFMDFMIAKRLRVVPNQTLEISHNLFSRLDPLEVPTYGDSDIRSRAFFVPYRTVMPAWNDFIEDTIHNYSAGSQTSSLVPYAHRIKNSQLVQFFMLSNSSLGYEYHISDETDDLDTADIVVILENGTPKGYNLTAHGARCLKLLLQCGIGVNFNLYGVASSSSTEIYHSAMQLLCVGKVYYDWYYQNQYINDEVAMSVEQLFNYDSSSQAFEEYFSYEKIALLFSVITKVNYDSDYFVSAWDNPVGPTDGSYSNVEIPDLTTKGTSSSYSVTYMDTERDGTPYISRNGGNPIIRLSQFSLDALKSLNDYAKRKQIAGARVFDRYLAEYGITLESEALKRSVYLTDYVQPVQIGDVTSTSDTSGASLGSYAGKGISNGNGNFTFTCYEHGEIIIISTIVPRVGYYQGADRTTYAQTRMDFWIPEFDSLGVQSLDTREVFMPLDARQQYPEGTTAFNTPVNYNNLVFGFVPRYAEYKRGIDQITGDFRLRSRGAGNDSWTLFRDMLPSFAKNGVVGTKHDRIFTTGRDSSQYNRLFNVMNDDYDHFKIDHYFNIKSSFPGKSLFDDYEYKDEDKAKRVNIDVQGVKAN